MRYYWGKDLILTLENLLGLLLAIGLSVKYLTFHVAGNQVMLKFLTLLFWKYWFHINFVAMFMIYDKYYLWMQLKIILHDMASNWSSLKKCPIEFEIMKKFAKRGKTIATFYVGKY